MKFSWFHFILCFEAHSYTLLRSHCKFSTSSQVLASPSTFESSTYFTILHTKSSKSGLRSEMNIRNSRGPIMLPCGIPLLRSASSERVFPILAYWFLWERNSNIYFMSFPFIHFSKSLFNNTLWSTRSKALKSLSRLIYSHYLQLMIFSDISCWFSSCVNVPLPVR